MKSSVIVEHTAFNRTYFLYLKIYNELFDIFQTTTTMLLQGERMDARISAEQSQLMPVASLNFVKMAVITVLIPVLDRVVFPLMYNLDRKPTLLQRIGQS